MEISNSKHRMLYIYQSMRLIEDSLVRKTQGKSRDNVFNIVRKRIIENDMVIDMVLYRLTGCYIPKIVKENIHLIFTPTFAEALIKKAISCDITTNFPNGIYLSSALGKDSQGVLIWEILRNTNCVKKALNYMKIKSPKTKVFV